jgi:AmmeMemoRadiSam system protein B
LQKLIKVVFVFRIRQPFAAGIYYNLDPEQLKMQIASTYLHKFGPKKIKTEKSFGAIVPHDKLSLSGHISAWAYSKLEKANYILLGANHSGIGAKFAIVKEGLWRTPLGEISISSSVAEKIIVKSKILEFDVIAHEKEHSLEVQIPFLQHRFGNDFKIVPIVITNSFLDHDFVEMCEQIGEAIASVIKTEKEKWLVIASTNLTEGNTKNFAEKNDKKILAAIKTFDVEKIFKKMKDLRFCGYGAVLAAIAAAKALGAKSSKFLQYSNSFEVLKNPEDVAGYAAFLLI